MRRKFEPKICGDKMAKVWLNILYADCEAAACIGPCEFRTANAVSCLFKCLLYHPSLCMGGGAYLEVAQPCYYY